ncbi:MAG: hypothetical protein M1833_003534 [Piccolia ochrophora]|nr:MAG: hypothetical protein M1833_003534 [Piccolia ochrophora]
MSTVLLAINAGSSSVKISVFKTDRQRKSPTQLAEIQVAGLTAPPVTLTYDNGKEKIKGRKLDQDINSQDDAFGYMLDHLIKDSTLSDIGEKDKINVACHRIVHGGNYEDATVIDTDTFDRLRELTDLAPLHNAPALGIVQSCMKHLQSTKNIAFFDSAFHHTLPEHIRTYPIDQAVAKKNQLRKYGFHGISYSFITRSVAEFLQKPQEETNIIALHLGSGASACAIRNGQSLDTSLVFHFTHDAGKPSRTSTKEMHITTAEEILNKSSGWSSLTQSTDFSLITSSLATSPASKLAFDIFIDRIIGFVGAYFVRLGGQVDALVFAGGIGEKSAVLRERVVEGVQCLGFGLDRERSEKVGDDEGVVVDISEGEGGRRTLIVRTDEQFEMARECIAKSKF